MAYVVSVVGNPTPAWIRWNPNTNLPCFTFERPDGISMDDACRLAARAYNCCGGTFRIVKA